MGRRDRLEKISEFALLFEVHAGASSVIATRRYSSLMFKFQCTKYLIILTKSEASLCCSYDNLGNE